MMPGETAIATIAISEIPEPTRDRRGAIRADFYVTPTVIAKFESRPTINATLKNTPER